MAWAIHREWGNFADNVKRELREVISTISEFERVRLLTPSDQIADAKRQSFNKKVEIIAAPVDDIWMRDIAPTFARRGSDLVAVDWNFNGWGSTSARRSRPGDRLAGFGRGLFGLSTVNSTFIAEGGSFITDGKGTLITTRSCLLNKNRNPKVTEAEIESGLRALGAQHVIWLEGDRWEPITSGHIDGYAMFSESGEVLIEDANRENPRESARLRDIETLKSSCDANGKSLIVRLVRPARRAFWAFDDDTFAPSYLNAYIANGAVVASKFGDPARDRAARKALQEAFPRREIRMLAINHLASGGGGIRCLTQPVPAKQ